MAKIYDGGPAFPYAVEHIFGGGAEQIHGMSLRDWFKGKALASGLCPHNVHEHEKIAAWCDSVADAMLSTRKNMEKE